MTVRADSLPGRVVAIVSRRAPAFQPRQGERTGLAWAVRAALPGTRDQAPPVGAVSASERGSLGGRVVPPTDPVVTVEPWRWGQIRAASVGVETARSARVMPSLVGLVAAGLLAAAAFALTTLAPVEDSAPAGPPPSSTAAVSPSQTVVRYFDAINARDYRTAWALGGRNLSKSYQAFTADFAGTTEDRVTILAASGDEVVVALSRQSTDGTTHGFHGTYTVHAGVIIAETLRSDPG